jgi:hypothetical protein
MLDDDVVIGMKVVPHAKTAMGWEPLERSQCYARSVTQGHGYLFVTGKLTTFRKEFCWILSDTMGENGDFFNACDFEPFEKQEKKEVTTTITPIAQIDKFGKITFN